MQDVEVIRNWIRTFPQWGTADLEMDQLGVTPDSAGLYYQGMEILGRREDVQGNVEHHCRHSFLLRRIFLTRQGGSAWMEDFSRWIMAQSEEGTTPVFANGKAPFQAVARNAKADWQKQTGTTVYTVRLDVEFEIA